MEAEPTAPAPSSAWMKHLERAHERAHAAARMIEDQADRPSPHLAPAARQLERGLAAMYDAFDGRADRITAIGMAHGRLWDAAIRVAEAGLSPALASLREACGELVAAEERFPRVPLAEARPKLRAGSDTLALHAVERASITPMFRAPPEPEPEEHVAKLELPEPTTFEELAKVAEAARRFAAERAKAKPRRRVTQPTPKRSESGEAEMSPGFASAPNAALSEDAFVRHWARECFEDVGMLGLQRAPLAGDDWRACQALERRLVSAVDAIAALGPVAIAHVEPLALDAPVANPMSVFAAALIGGCLEGRDGLAAAERVLHRFGSGDPLVAEPFLSAMKLAPNPLIRDAMCTLYTSLERGCKRIALAVLAHRHWLEPAELDALAQEEDAELLSLALPALAFARHPDLGRAAERALARDDANLQMAALDALALGAHPEAAKAARAAALGALGDAALVALAIVGDRDDALFVLDRAQRARSPLAIEAVGWAGLVDAVPMLLQALETADDEVKLAAGAALDRLLGANLVDRIEILPDAIEPVPVIDPDPERRPNRAALEQMVSDSRDRPPEVSKEALEVPAIDPTKWRAHWAEHGRALDAKQRIRRGQAHSPSVSLYELDRLALSAEDRRRLHRELAMRTGRVVHFDPHDFVAVQEKGLAAWQAVVRAAAAVPGAWGRPVRR